MIGVTSREQLADAIANIIFSTPPEFIQFDEVDIEKGDEYIVDGDPETQWYAGCGMVLQEEGTIVIRIPLKRKASVYEYHADAVDESIKEAEQRVAEMKIMQELYRDIARSERRRKDLRKDGVSPDAGPGEDTDV